MKYTYIKQQIDLKRINVTQKTKDDNDMLVEMFCRRIVYTFYIRIRTSLKYI